LSIIKGLAGIMGLSFDRRFEEDLVGLSFDRRFEEDLVDPSIFVIVFVATGYTHLFF
jgi:hypothetical protein